MFKILKSLVLGLFLFLFTIFAQFPVFASEEVSNFYSRIEINQDTSISITEQIDYVTTISKHGIYRYIPISYNYGGQKKILPITNITINDELGQPIPFEKTSDGKFVTLKIGDPDTTFSGEKTYIISYQVERAINQFDTHNEFYWDIVGEGWQFPVLQSSATIISNFASIEDINCYSGPVGGNDKLCNFEAGENQATFFYNNQINYGDNMTVVLKLPKESQLIFPSDAELKLLWLQSNWPFFTLPLPTLILFVWWYKKGRDYEFLSANIFNLDPDQPQRLKPFSFKHRVPMVYEPLKDLTPGEAGGILDEKFDIQDIVAEILDLARKKYLTIKVSEEKKFFSTVRDYEFIQLKTETSQLNEAQKYLFTQLFKTGSPVKLSKLKGTFYTAVAQVKSKLENSLIAKNLYTSKPSHVIAKGFVLFLGLDILVFMILSITLFPLGIYWPIVILFIQAPFGLILAKNMIQKTALGNNYWLQTRGLKATIERGAWREKIKEKNLFIEEVLPFAIALGVVDKLAKDLQELNLTPPDYISGSGLKTWAMTDFVSGFSQEVGNSLSYNPSSSSSSGSSGFSGGSSGGGGGGGGGGSW
jgi:uncharacterized membrane protein YgcG